MASETGTQAWRDVYFTVRDGLRLHARHYPAPGSTRRAVLCLPGLTRNSQDFNKLALEIGDPRGHRRAVYAIDYRGRGLSEHDKDWKNYSPLIECLDVIDLIAMEGLSDCAVLGTSRGGLIAMILALMQPGAIGAVILNDIGPEIEKAGLTRIIGYVGKVPVPIDWREATALVHGMNRRFFTGLSEADWEAFARASFLDLNGLPAPSYDPAIARTMSIQDIAAGVPTMWPQFDALCRVPMLAIRGENSDILSRETLRKMQERHTNMRSVTVAGQGHAPLLLDDQTIGEISDCLIDTD